MMITVTDEEKKLFDLIKMKGIVVIQDNSIGDYRKVHDRIKNAKESVKIIAYHADPLLGAIRKHLSDCINNYAADVKILVAKKGSIFLTDVEALDGASNLGAGTLGIINGIRQGIETNKNGKKGSIDYGECNTEIRYALTLVDDNWAWWTPYHTGLITEEITSFELEKTGKGSFINLCIKHFDKLWEKYGTKST